MFGGGTKNRSSYTFLSVSILTTGRALVAAAFLAALFVGASGARADMVSASDAQGVVQGWLSADGAPLGAALGWAVDSVDGYANEYGEPIYYIVYLQPSGFVVVAADDMVEPIIAFSASGTYDPSPDNPLGALVSADLRGRVETVRGYGVELLYGTEHDPDAAQAKWNLLQDYALSPPETAGQSSVTDERVTPFVLSEWSQGQVSGSDCYNYYTPSNYVCGCVATAMAQLMRFHQHPSSGVGTTTFTVTVDGTPTDLDLRGGDGSGGAYSWSDMVLVPASGVNTTQRQAIGALCYDAGLSVDMAYTASASGANTLDGADAFTGTFGYSNAKRGYNSGSNIGTPLNTMMNPNLDAGYPVMLGITGDGGHAILCDGYGYTSSTLYHHLNLGWAGSQDAWYALPSIPAGAYTFTSVYKCVYNVYTTGTGEIISGRVTDSGGTAISGAAISANSGSYTDTTDSNGIYALAKIPAGTSYTIDVTKSGYSFASQTISTGTSTDNTTTTGNQWEVDFTGGSGAAAAMTTPASDGATLTGSSFTFAWDAGTSVTQYRLWVGTTSGGTDIYNQSTGTTQSATVTGIPTDASSVYVRLSSYFDGAWYYNEYTYVASGSAVDKAEMTTPASDGATLSGASFTFAWDAGTSVTQYRLWVGTTSGGSDIYNQSTGTTQSAAVTGLPADGSSVYVRLYSYIDSTWYYNNYTYVAATVADDPAEMTYPASDGDPLPGATCTFTWDAGANVTQYRLWVGTTSGGSDIYNQSTGTTQQAYVTGIPTDGGSVYVRLNSMISGSWQYNAYTYVAASSGTATKLKITMIASQSAGVGFDVVVDAVDASDSAANVTQDTAVSLSLNTGTGALGGTTTGTISSGTSTVTISGVTYDTAETGVVVAAARTSGDILGSATSNAFDVAVGVADRLAVAAISTQGAGDSFDVVVSSTDQYGNAANVSGDTAISISLKTGTGSVGGTTTGTITADSSSVTISGVTYDTKETGVVLTIARTSGDSLTSVDSNAFEVTEGTADRLSITTIGGQAAGSAFDVTVTSTDQHDNASNVTTDTLVTLTVKTGTGTIGGTVTGTISGGASSITISGVTYDTAESGVVLTATASGGDSLTAADSNGFTVSAGTATKLAADTISSQQAGQAFSVVVRSTDANGNPAVVTGDTGVELSVQTGTGSLAGGTTTGTITGGASSVTISGVKYDTMETGVVLTVTRTSGDNLTAVDTNSFDVAAGPASKLAVATISSQEAGTAFDVTVNVLDALDHASGVSAMTLAKLTVKTGTGTLGGTVTGVLSPGESTVTISGVTYDTAEGGVVLTASALGGDTLTAADSNGFTVAAATAVKLSVTTIAAQIANKTFDVTVTAQDTLDNAAAVSADTLVTLSLKTGTGNLGGTVTGTISSGGTNVTISGVTYDKVETSIVLTSTATSGDSLTAGDSNSFNVTADSLDRLSVATVADQRAGETFDVVVNSTDAYGNAVVTTQDTDVALSVKTGTGAVGGTTTGTITSGTSSVTVSGVTYDTLETGVVLTVSRTSGDVLTAGDTNSFDVSAGVADRLSVGTIAEQGQNVGFGVAITSTDQYGSASNVTADTTVTLTVKTGTGAVSGTVLSVISAGSSTVTISGVNYDTAETGVVLTATASGGDSLTAADSNAFNVVARTAGKLVFATVSDQGGGVPFSVTVDVQDGSGYSANVSQNTTVTLSVKTGTGTIGGTVSGTVTAGTSTVTISGATYDTAETGVVLTATASGGDTLTAADSNSFDVTSAAAVITTPSADGATLTSASYTFQWSAGTGVSQYRLWVGTTSGDKDLYNQATGTTQSATVTGLPTDGSTVYVRLNSYMSGSWQYNDTSYTAATVGTAMKLAVTTIASQTAGTGFDVVVSSADSVGTATNVTQDTGVSISLKTGTGSVGGTTTGTITSGTSSVTISGVTYDTAESGVVLTAARTSGDSLTSADSNAFAVAAGAASKLAVATIADQGTDVGFSVTLNVQDANGNTANVTQDTGVSLAKNTGTGAIGGTTTGTISSGTSTVTISGVIWDTASAGVSLTASRTSGDVLTAADSNTFTVADRTPTKLQVVTIASQDKDATFDVVVNALDNSDNAADATQDTTITLTVKTGTGAIGGTVSGTLSSGTNTMTISGATYDTAETGVVLTATASGGDALTAADSNAFAVYDRTPSKLSITTITDQGKDMPFDVVVTVLDATDTAANTTQDTTVTLTVKTGTGSLGGTVSGTVSSGTSSLTISGVTYDTYETGVVLTATASGGDSLTAADSNTFDVSTSAARMTAPSVNGATLTGTSYTFQWDAGSGVSQYRLWVGTTSGGADIYNQSTGTTQSATVTGLPSDGSSVYVRLNSLISGSWSYNAYTYVAVSAGVATHLSVDTIASQTAATGFDVVVNSVDALGTSVNVTQDTGVTLSLKTGTGSVGGTVSGTITSGTNTVTISGVTYDTAESGVVLTATRTSGDTLAAVDSNAFVVSAGTATKLAVSTIADQGQNVAFSVTVTAQDANDNTATVSVDTAISLTKKTGTGTLGGTTTGTISAGSSSVTITGVTYDTAEGGVELTATRTSGDVLTAADSNAFAVASRTATKLQVGTITDQVKDQTFNVVVNAVDNSDNVANVTQDTTVTLTVKTGTGAVGGTVTGTLSSGTSSVTISGATYDTLETGVVLTATASGGDSLTAADSNSFDVANGPAQMTTPSADGATLNGASYTFAWSSGSGVSQYRLWVGTTSGGKDIYNQGTGTTQSATVTGLPTDGSSVYVQLNSYMSGTWSYNEYTYTAATVGTAMKLAVGTVSGQTAGSAFDVVVNAVDTVGTATNVTQDTGVTLSLKTGTGSLGGTVSGTITSGTSTVTISGATYDKAETGVVLTATRTSGDSLTAVDSNAFNVSAGAASKLVVASIADQGTDVAFSVTLNVQDANDNTAVVTSDTGISLTKNTGTGAIGGTTTGTITAGTSTVTITGVTWDTASAGVSLTASRTGGDTLTAANSNTFTVADRTPTKLEVVTVASQAKDTAFDIVVNSLDNSDNVANATQDTTITMTVKTGTGAVGGTVSGTLSSGTSTVTISGLTYDTAETGVVLTATASGGDALTAADTNAFDVIDRTPVKLSIATIVDQGRDMAFDVVVNVLDGTDTAANTTQDTTVTLTLKTGTGSLGGTVSGVVSSGTSTVTISGATYDKYETGVVLTATASGGDTLTAADSNTFDVSYAAAQMTSPASDGDRLAAASHTFQWNSGSGVTQYRLWVGTTSGGSDVYNQSTGMTQSATVTGLATDGSNVYVRLNSYVNGSWSYNEYTYLAAQTGLATTLSVGTIGAQAAGATFDVVVNAKDAFGSAANVTQDTQVTLSKKTGTGTLGGTVIGTISSGSSSVTISGVTYTKAESGVVLTATATSGDTLTAVDSNAFTVGAGAAADLAFQTIATQGAGDAFSVTVYVKDANGNSAVVSQDTGVSLSKKTGTGTLGGTTTGTITSGTGSATISGVTYDTTEGGVELTVTRTSGDVLNPADSNAFNVTVGTADRLAVAAIGGQVAGATFNVTVNSTDQYGTASTVSADTTVTLTVKTGTGSVSGTVSGTMSAGTSSVVISGVIYDVAESGVVLTATASGGDSLTAADSAAFTVTAGSLSNLSITTIAGQAAGETFNVTVKSTDSMGNPIVTTQDTGVALSVNTGTGAIGGTTTGTILGGTNSVTISGITYDTMEGSVSLTATRTSGDVLTAANSNTFTVGAGSPTDLSVATISQQSAGVAFDVTLNVIDQYGNSANVSQDTDVALAKKTGAGVIGGTTIGTISNGTSTVTISGVTWSTKETGVSLTASRTAGEVLNAADSNTFTVIEGPATKLAVATVVAQQAGETFSVTVNATDAADNASAITQDTTITLSVKTGTAGSLDTGTKVATMTAGTSAVTITGVIWSTMENSVVMTATASGGDTLTAADSNAFNVTAGPADRLAIATITGKTAGTAFDVVVKATDQYGNDSNLLVPSTITLTRATGTGTLGGTLVGSMTAGTNSVTISGVTYDTAEAGVSLTATEEDGFPLTAHTSNTFTVSANSLSALTVSTVADQVAGATFNVTVESTDAYGNPVVTTQDTGVALSVNTGSGALGGTTTGTITSGTSSVTISGVTYDTGEAGVSLTATRTSGDVLTAANSNLFTVAAGTADRLAVTAIGTQGKLVPFNVTVTSTDAIGNASNLSADTTVTLTVKTGSGAVGGTTTGTITAGTSSVTISNVTYSVAEAGVVLTATASGGDTLTAADSGAFTVEDRSPDHLKFGAISQQVTGATFNVAVSVEDSSNNTALVVSDTTVTLTVKTGTGALGGTTTGTITAGTSSVTISGVTYDTAEAGVVLTATASGGDSMTAADSSAFTVVDPVKAAMTTPASGGATLTGASFTFQWNSGTGVAQYRLWVGTSLGANDIYNESTGATQQATVTGLPTDGSAVYVRLNSYINGAWEYNAYQYVAYTDSVFPQPAEASLPVGGDAPPWPSPDGPPPPPDSGRSSSDIAEDDYSEGSAAVDVTDLMAGGGICGMGAGMSSMLCALSLCGLGLGRRRARRTRRS